METTENSSIKQLSNAELEIMQLLWQEKVPLTAQQILSKMPEKYWKVETLLTFLSRLQKKGAVSANKIPTAGRRAHSEFFTIVSAEEYRKAQSLAFIEKYHNGDPKAMITALLKDELLTKADLQSALAAIQ